AQQFAQLRVVVDDQQPAGGMGAHGADDSCRRGARARPLRARKPPLMTPLHTRYPLLHRLPQAGLREGSSLSRMTA
ncbi:MAG TPA: hypothetical protein VK052_17055, partial [Zeimonas sp.]|nr:hypothetical protein [Zeimonas sp.]